MNRIDHLIDRSDPGAWARALRHREESRVELQAQHKPERAVCGEGEGEGSVHNGDNA